MADAHTLDIPQAFICPISQQIMRDPYVDSDGNSYDKVFIFEWLSKSSVSPITRNHLTTQNLVPNRVLKQLIESFASAHGIDLTESEGKVDESLQRKSEEEEKLYSALIANLGRKPLMLYALIDTSGSMGIACGLNSGTGENDGYSRLDLVKHTLNTIIHSLTSLDEICIITFSTVASILCQRTKLTEENKEILEEKVKLLRNDGQTNIWDSMRLAFESIKTVTDKYFNIEIYLLTDGEPNINPPGDLVTTVANCMEKVCHTAEIFPTINTFGYGYNLDSTMLYNMARISNGIFGFIPDSTMVGTIFINSLSNSLVGSDYPQKNNGKLKEILRAFTDMLRSLWDKNELWDKKSAKLNNFVEYLKSFDVGDGSGEADTEYTQKMIQALLEDCSDNEDPSLGQIAKAIRPKYFSQWGMHYIFSVLSAFEKRVCINFKDRAMQNFKTDEFLMEQKRVEEVFTFLPPPVPSNAPVIRGTTSVLAHIPADMSSYLNPSGGCFSADSLVFKFCDRTKSVFPIAIGSLRKGDVVQSCVEKDGCGGWIVTLTEVECVVKLQYKGELHSVHAHLQLTPYHPIIERTGRDCNAEPCFPVEVSRSTVSWDGFVVDVVLRNRGLIRCCSSSGQDDEGAVLLAATFGHNCRVGKFQHAYFGSEEVVDDLRKHHGWERGMVELREYCYLRDEGGLVGKMCFQVERTCT